MITAGSLVSGLVVALMLVAGPFAARPEAATTGALMLGFAVGWALLAGLSLRVTQQPQRWAAVPASYMGLVGVALIVFAPGPGALTALGWAWPPSLVGLVGWMFVQVRRQSFGGRRLLYPVFAVLVLAAAGGAYETIANATDPDADPVAGGRLVDVGGHRLHIRCTGSGSPAVVLEPGLGEPASAMARLLAPGVTRTTTVCVYDRAGHGRSDHAPPAGADPARDLHTLLQRAHVPGPYVVAGHSLGGALALDFARRYPEEVAGVVLLDSMHPQQHSASPGTQRLPGVVAMLSRLGLARVVFDPEDGKPATQAAQFVRDVQEMPAALERAARVGDLNGKRLTVVSAGIGSLPDWGALQTDLATLSRRSVHRTIAGATHTSLVNDEHDAASSSRAIADIVNDVRRAHR